MRVWLAVAGLLLGAMACTHAVAPPGDDVSWVVEKFLAARQQRDLEATMECFAATPEMRTSLGVGWAGRDAVRAIMSYRLTDTYSVGDLRVAGHRATWSEHVRRSVAGSPFAVFDEEVEAIVVDGHITSLVTYVGGAHPAAAVEPAPQLSVGTDLLVPFSILVLVATAVMVWPPPVSVQTRPVTSGHLLNGLRDYVARRG